MSTPAYPGNNKLPPKKTVTAEQKNIQPVATGKRKKKSLGKQFSETFVAGDLKSTVQYVTMDVAIPAFKDLIADVGIQSIERLIFGEARSRRRPMGPVRPGPRPGRIQYQNMMSPPPQQQQEMVPARQRSRPTPTVTDFDDVVLSTRSTAETVLERMSDVLSQYGSVSVADFYSLVDLSPTHTDNNWGWTDLKGSHVTRNRDGGYLLNLPDPSAF